MTSVAESLAEDFNFIQAAEHFKSAFNCYAKSEIWDSANNAFLYVLESYRDANEFQLLKSNLDKYKTFVEEHPISEYEYVSNQHSILLYQCILDATNGRTEKAFRTLDSLQTEFNRIIENNLYQDWEFNAKDYARIKSIFFYKAAADIYEAQKAYNSSLDFLYQRLTAAKLFPKAYEEGIIVTCLLDISDMLMKLNRSSEAEQKINEALKLLPRVREVEKYDKLIFFQKAKFEKAKLEYDIALSHLNEVIHKYGKHGSDWFDIAYRIAELYFLKSDHELALKNVDESLKAIKDSPINYARSSLLKTKILLKANQKEAAFKACNRGVNQFDFKEGLPFNIILAELLNLKAEICLNQEMDIETIQNCKSENQKAIAILEKFRTRNIYKSEKEDLVEYYFDFFETSMKLLYKQYELSKDETLAEEMLLISEQSKAISLLESLAESTAKQYAQLPDDLVNKEAEIKKAIVAVSDSIRFVKDPENL
ncbi:MAG: hypothetical protein AAGK97_02780, partial [Bacteroidota bacterium]